MTRWVALVTILVALFCAPRAKAAASAAFEAAAAAEIDAIDLEAGKLYREANSLRDSQPERASQLYAQVIARAPTFDHALRRKCGIDAVSGKMAEALLLCRRALAVRRTPENLIGLATAIVARGADVSGALRQESLGLIDEAVRIAPAMDYVHHARCQVANALGEWTRMKEALAQLDRIAPNDPHTQFCGAILALAEGRIKDADDRIARAEALGAPAEIVNKLKSHRDSVEAGGSPFQNALVLLVKVTVGWAVGLMLLALAGFLASRLTLRAIENNADETPAKAAYRTMILIGAAYYYVSLPLVAVFVIGLAGAVTLFFLYLGVIPIKLLVIVGLLTLATLWATLRSVFVRVPDEPPGRPLGKREHPRLRALLATVAKKIGTRELDEVRLTVGTDLAVTERGRSLSGSGDRVLILGVGLLDGLRVRELKSLLAHEFGHFRNEDTAGGGLAIRVRRSILMMAIHLAQSGAATWWNPAWWFVLGYHKLFLRMTQGASRLQEVLADRWAVNAYGSKAFRRGLRHVIKRSVAFDEHVERSVSDAGDGKGWANLYSYRPSKPIEDDELDEKYRELLDAAASPYDSHPAPKDRLASAKAMAAEGEPFTEGDEEEAWSLFDDRDTLERKMTDEVRAILAKKGIEVAEEDEDDDDE